MSRPLGTILLAEDDANDVLLTQLMIQKCRIWNPLHVVDDGDQAIMYLQGKGLYADNSRYPVPILFMLDLRMSRVGGLEVLRWMRDHQEFAVNTFVLTAFQDLNLMNEVYQLGAKSFLTKPLHERDFTSLLCIQNGISIAPNNPRFSAIASEVGDHESALIGY
ncbi:MAG TPA: response regulator [Verrucomicrobiae bacterium]|nr:response regulator [Verrucomicrobiae bacterium]